MTRTALESAVVGAMDAAAQKPMQWGVDDCGLWVANALRPVLGYDPAGKIRGRYKTHRGWLRAVGAPGLFGQLRGISRRHKWQRIDPAQAQPGDVGVAWTVYAGRPSPSTVICRGKGWFVGRAEFGFAAVRADKVVIAWSVLPDALPSGPGPRISLKRIPTRPEMVPTTAAAHDPISIFILGVIGLEATATAVAITTVVLSVALSVGVSLVSSLLQPHTGATLSDNSISETSAQAAQITERQPVPFKRVIVGSAYVGGALFYEQVKAPYLTMGVLINYGQISGIDKVFIGTNQLSFTSLVPNTILTPVAVDGQPSYSTRLRVSFRYGSDTQAVDPLILDKYSNVGSEFRQRGIATAVYEFHYGGTDTSAATQAAFTALWGQVQRPATYVVARGVVVYDPRDATQSLTDETTWKWSRNATLVQAWYLTRAFGGRIPKANIRWDKIATSADYDDSLMVCNDGTTIAKHTIDGVISLNQQPFQVMQQLLTANRGMVLESGGQIWIQSSYPRSAVVAIHDRILAGGLNYQAAKQKSDLVNKLQVRFVSPDQDYQTVDGPILSRTDLQTADQEVLPATLALNFTQDHRRAQRLQKCFLASARLGRTITCNVDIRLMAVAADELVGSVVTVNSVLFSKANGDYMVTAVGFADDCTTLSLALAEYDPTVETDWNSATDEQAFVLATINTA